MTTEVRATGGGRKRSGGGARGGASPAAATGAATGPAGSGTAAGPVRTAARRTAPPRRRRKAPARWVERLLPDPDTQGPRVRLGIGWFLLALPAVVAGPWTTAALFGLIAGIGALQSWQAWREAGRRGSRVVAGLAAVAMPGVATVSYGAVGGVILALVPAALAAAAVTRRRNRPPLFVAAATTIRCALPVGIAAAGMVALVRVDLPSAVVFFVLVSAYDAGAFIVGAEASSRSHGIIAGIVVSLVAAAPVWVAQVWTVQATPFADTEAVWVFAGLIAVTAPLGQLAAGAASPPGTWIPCLRRLDSLIVAAPVWTAALWSYLAS